MAYFTMQFRAATGEVAFETDFTTHELIPLVRHFLRSLTPYREADVHLAGHRVIVTPHYEGRPNSKVYVAPEIAKLVQPPAAGNDGGDLLQISEEDLDVYAPVSYADEFEAYYNPGTSHLCVDCPERQRCPGSGRQTETGEWILLDPAAPRSNEPIIYFTLRIESSEGRFLYQCDVPLSYFQLFVNLTARLLDEKGRLPLPASGNLRADIIVRYEGQPRIDPVLSPKARPRVVISDQPPRVSSRPPMDSSRPLTEAGPPRRLVDWDSLEEKESEQPEFEIKVLPTEPEPLAHKPTPEHAEAVGTISDSQILIFMRRSALQSLQSQKDLRTEAGGILVGEVYLRPADDRPWIEIVGALPAVDGRGEPASMSLDFNLLQDRLNREFPGRHAVGWYRFHLLGNTRVSVYDGRRLYTAGIGERLLLLRDESFMHQSFFPQPWHVGLVIDGIDRTSRFYHRQGEEIVGCDGYMLVE
jgi:hypothetical protein